MCSDIGVGKGLSPIIATKTFCCKVILYFVQYYKKYGCKDKRQFVDVRLKLNFTDYKKLCTQIRKLNLIQ